MKIQWHKSYFANSWIFLDSITIINHGDKMSNKELKGIALELLELYSDREMDIINEHMYGKWAIDAEKQLKKEVKDYELKIRLASIE